MRLAEPQARKPIQRLDRAVEPRIDLFYAVEKRIDLFSFFLLHANRLVFRFF